MSVQITVTLPKLSTAGSLLIITLFLAINPEDIEELFVVTLTEDELVLVKLQGSLGSIIEVIIRDHGHNLRIEDRS